MSITFGASVERKQNTWKLFEAFFPFFELARLIGKSSSIGFPCQENLWGWFFSVPVCIIRRKSYFKKIVEPQNCLSVREKIIRKNLKKEMWVKMSRVTKLKVIQRPLVTYCPENLVFVPEGIAFLLGLTYLCFEKKIIIRIYMRNA